MIEELVNSSFNEEKYLNFLKERFGIELKKAEVKKATNSNYIKTYQEVGFIEIDDIDEVGFFIVESSTPNIENIRVGFNDFIGNLIKTDKYGYDGLIVAIYHPNSDVWRLSYVALELDEKRELSTKPKRFTFELGNVPTTTAKEQLKTLTKNSSLEDIKEAFSVEKLSNEFFRAYKNLYHTLVENILVVIKKNRTEIQIASKETIKDEKIVRAYIKKMLGRIVFLYFVQKKGWLNDDKKFLSNLFNEHASEEINFFDSILEPLFVEILNKKRDDDKAVLGGKEYLVPYLNGGLFEKDDEDKLDFGVPNSDLKEVFELFDSYNFTIIEHTPHDSEVAIDPEMLGRIFEDLLEDRKEKGAFYTPREIVHYMCQESIKNYLESKPKEQTELEYIKQIKVLDPAIGSGAFPMGMLHEIIEKRHFLGDETELSEMKREIIQNSIYGVDIEPSAVEIAKLRFWLSIVVDEAEPSPLPNLAYKIMVGNSLLEKINNEDPLKNRKDLDKKLNELNSLFREFYNTHEKKNQIKIKISQKLDTVFNLVSKRYSNQATLDADPKEAQKRVEEALKAKYSNDILKDIKEKQYSDKIFLYKLFFRDVLNNGGFDVVIGNPPYVRHEKIKELKPKLKAEGYKSYNGTADLYIYFFEQGYRLLKENGVLSFITSNKYTRAKYGKEFRKFVLENSNILEYIDFNGVKVFESATVDTSILSYRKSKERNSSFLYCDIDDKYKKESELEEFVEKKGFDYLQSDLSVDSFSFATSEELAIKKRVEMVGTPLKEWDIEIYRGIQTGNNNAFIIDNYTYQKIIESDINALNLLKPLLQGRDIKKYNAHFNKKYLIYATDDIKIENYPSIYKHLLEYKDILEKKIEVKQNKMQWYTLYRPAKKHIKEFSKEKIVFSKASKEQAFCYDNKNLITLNTSYIATGKNLKFILSILNSKVSKYIFLKFLQSGGIAGEITIQAIEQLPIPQIPKETQKPFEILVDYILFAKEQNMSLEASLFESVIDGMVYDLYFEEEMKRGDCFISDEVNKVIIEFNNSIDRIKEMYKILNTNKTIGRGLIYSRIIPVVEIINGASK